MSEQHSSHNMRCRKSKINEQLLKVVINLCEIEVEVVDEFQFFFLNHEIDYQLSTPTMRGSNKT